MARFQHLALPALGALALLAALAAPASAATPQAWLAPAYPGIALAGPERAKGAVVWSHGRSVDSEDSHAPTPAYMALLREDGWDTFRYNRLRDVDTLAKSSVGLAKIAADLKAEGYRKVALTGQSFGGFLALMAADASDQVDDVIATAPAAYGSFSDYYGSWLNNATKLYPLLQQVRSARVMVFYFHGDDFDPGGRGERSREILDARHIANVVVDQPPQLTSHWAATTPLFTKRFGGCIEGFLDAAALADDARCDNDALWAGSEPEPIAMPLQGPTRPNGN
jgi:pimeloyl-ACP methyl ester carboxylesterase